MPLAEWIIQDFNLQDLVLVTGEWKFASLYRELMKISLTSTEQIEI